VASPPQLRSPIRHKIVRSSTRGSRLESGPRRHAPSQIADSPRNIHRLGALRTYEVAHRGRNQGRARAQAGRPSPLWKEWCRSSEFRDPVGHKIPPFSPLTHEARRPARPREAAMENSNRRLPTANGRREFPAAVPWTEAGVTPVVGRPDRSSEFPAHEPPTRIDLNYDHRDQQSWDTPPRYSVVRPFSALPAPELPTPSRLHGWSAKLLFVSVLSGIMALLGFALLKAVARGLPALSHLTAPFGP